VVLADIGEVGGDRLEIQAGTASLDLQVERLKDAFERAIPDLFR
jgi:hypothetical protein